jgi:hypothetical protein
VEHGKQPPEVDLKVLARIQTGGEARWLAASADASGWRIEIPRVMGRSRLDLGIGSPLEISGVAFHVEDEFGRKTRGKYAFP